MAPNGWAFMCDMAVSGLGWIPTCWGVSAGGNAFKCVSPSTKVQCACFMLLVDVIFLFAARCTEDGLISRVLCQFCCSHDDLDALDPMANLPHSGMIELCLARQPYLVRSLRWLCLLIIWFLIYNSVWLRYWHWRAVARFAKYLATVLQLSYDNAKVTIDLRRTSDLPNISQRTQGFSCERSTCKIVGSSEIVFIY